MLCYYSLVIKFSFLLTLTAWHWPHSPVTRGPPGPQQQTCSGGFAGTDERTPDRCTDLASHTMRSVPVRLNLKRLIDQLSVKIAIVHVVTVKAWSQHVN